MEKVLNAIEKGLKAAVIVLIGFLMLWVCALVPARYFFHWTPSYGEELSRYVFVWIVFLTLPILAKTGGHMAIEAVTSRISGNKLRFARLGADVFTMIFLAIMVYQGCFMVNRASFQTSPGLGLSMSYVYIVIPIGCGLMLLNVIHHFVATIRVPADRVK